MAKRAGIMVPVREPAVTVPAPGIVSYISLSGTKKIPKSPHAASIIRQQNPASRAAALFADSKRRNSNASCVQKLADIFSLVLRLRGLAFILGGWGRLGQKGGYTGQLPCGNLTVTEHWFTRGRLLKGVGVLFSLEKKECKPVSGKDRTWY